MKTQANKKTNSFKYISLVVLALITLSFSSCNDDEDPVVPEAPVSVDIATTLQQITDDPDTYNGDNSELKKQSIKSQRPKFKNLITALAKSGLVSTVAQNEFTVFAPTDEAFEQLLDELGVGSINDLTAEQLTPILLYHVVSGTVMSGDLTNGLVETVNGAYIEVDLSSGVMINDATVEIADLKALNGVIHVIDKVLLPPSMNLVEKAINFDPEFSILVEAVTKAGLGETLANDGPFTVFAPTNLAFQNLLNDLGPDVNSLDDIDSEMLVEILLYHVVEGGVFSMDLTNGMVPTLNGKTIEVDLSSGVMINDATVEIPNVQATNGVIHAIDKVLLPPKNIVETAISFDPEFSILVDAVVKAGLDETLATGGTFTVFAPTNAAFESLFSTMGISGVEELTPEQLAPILLYHVVNGKVMSSDLSNGFVPTLNGAAVEVDLSSGVMINSATVGIPDVEAYNGVIHAINEVLLPPTMNLVDLAISFNPEFSILVDAVTKAGLGETLANGGPYTVFAPTNQAFLDLLDDLGAEVNSLDDIPVADLTAILLYHVVEGRVYSSDLSAGTVPTLNGAEITVDLSDGVMIDDAKVTAPNVQATNGVIHVINKVIIP
ncbi:fasciclin domain-containing protein [Sunxiuqinia indica]|uniref:fasciclin domain-containing protein n=1 Tax=Sunxiuqinia indica TaxID=2692584 RepID=UPI00135C48AF|nr:fasciclin domain-containing protein [Sunxiuqinia indica]